MNVTVKGQTYTVQTERDLLRLILRLGMYAGARREREAGWLAACQAALSPFAAEADPVQPAFRREE